MPVTPNSIVTPQAFRTRQAWVTTANTTLSNPPTTNLQQIVVAGANGARITRLWATPTANVVAGLLQLWWAPNLGAPTYLALVEAKLLTAYTMAGSTAAPIIDFGRSDANPSYLPPNTTLWAGTGVNNNVMFNAEWGDF